MDHAWIVGPLPSPLCRSSLSLLEPRWLHCWLSQKATKWWNGKLEQVVGDTGWKHFAWIALSLWYGKKDRYIWAKHRLLSAWWVFMKTYVSAQSDQSLAWFVWCGRLVRQNKRRNIGPARGSNVGWWELLVLGLASLLCFLFKSLTTNPLNQNKIKIKSLFTSKEREGEGREWEGFYAYGRLDIFFCLFGWMDQVLWKDIPLTKGTSGCQANPLIDTLWMVVMLTL